MSGVTADGGTGQDQWCECEHDRGCHDDIGNCWHLDLSGDEDCDCDQYRMPAAPPVPDEEARTNGRVHELKTWPGHFDAVAEGRKTYELRRDDRGYAVGDVLRLREWDPIQVPHVTRDYRPRGYTGREIERVVTHVLRDAPGFGLADGFALLSLAARTTPARPDNLRQRVEALAEEVTTAHAEAKANARPNRDAIVRNQYIGRAWALGDVLMDLRHALADTDEEGQA